MITQAFINKFNTVNVIAGQQENGKILSAIVKSKCGKHVGTVHTLINNKETKYRVAAGRHVWHFDNGNTAVQNAVWEIENIVRGLG